VKWVELGSNGKGSGRGTDLELFCLLHSIIVQAGFAQLQVIWRLSKPFSMSQRPWRPLMLLVPHASTPVLLLNLSSYSTGYRPLPISWTTSRLTSTWDTLNVISIMRCTPLVVLQSTRMSRSYSTLFKRHRICTHSQLIYLCHYTTFPQNWQLAEKWLLKCFENGDHVYSAYRQEQFVNKTSKISSNISKRNLRQFAHHP